MPSCDIRFKCPECEYDIEKTVLGPERDVDGAPETVESPLQCENCGERFEVSVTLDGEWGKATLIDHPKTEVEGSIVYQPPFDEEYLLDLEPPEDPYYIYRSSRDEAGELLKKIGGSEGSELVNRMVFTHYIGAMEAFLGDTFRNMIVADAKAMSRLIARDPKLNEERFSLADIDSSADLIKTRVLLRLRSVMWHNLKVVNALYMQVFKINILKKLGANSVTLEKAIEYRHDCVHRNGFDGEKNRLTVFTREYIESIVEIIDDLVLEIVDKQPL